MTNLIAARSQLSTSVGSPDRTRPDSAVRRALLRIVIVVAVGLGLKYIVWRWMNTINLAAWWIGVPLVAAETYSFVDSCLFGMTAWRIRSRPVCPSPIPGATVDVFVTTYNEPVDLVSITASAARDISWPHLTWILDDGDRAEMEELARGLGVGYIRRDAAWRGRPRHAKAGNLNNALMATSGEFLLVLDADQVPHPEILDRTLGWFTDSEVAFVQTPQWFVNVPADDPLGSQAPLFYGPIQQGKDGWNAAFFCGSNAVLRRESLMQIGLDDYVDAVEADLRVALARVVRVLRGARRRADRAGAPKLVEATDLIAAAARLARRELDDGEPYGEVTYRFQRSVDIVAADVADDLAAQPDDAALIDLVRALIAAVDVDRDDEAQPVMPLSTISVTEDMATAMRLHANGWKSVYHHEILAEGLAPEDLGSMLDQRLRWAQGTVQLMLRENPLTKSGLSVGQRLMYFATMWSYLSGFAALVYIAAPIVYLMFGIRPVMTYGPDFVWHIVPYLLLNQLVFAIAGRGHSSWRGQQYSLALFPIWIRACVTATANVWFGRDLRFVVTPKARQDHGRRWSLVRIQMLCGLALIVAIFVGLFRLAEGQAPTTIGTYINVAWALFDLLVLSVVVNAVAYRGWREVAS
jgi:cellulose synthase/poly-beta-1,6-N-acetylglucosamine synthase-like glycosyltransferase